MAQKHIQTSFAGGELSPTIAGRVDISKYQVGAAVMRNFFVDFRGGASTRPGTTHVGACRWYAQDYRPRLIPFVFNSDQAYVLELHADKMRVIFRGDYVLEPEIFASDVSVGSVITITATAHGFSDGDYVRFRVVGGALRPNGIPGVQGRTFRVANATTDTFQLEAEAVGGGYGLVSGTGWTAGGGALLSRIYEVPIPWSFADLYRLDFAQSADVLTVTHPGFPVHEIRRLGHANWQIIQQTYGSSLPPPSSLATEAFEAAGAGTRYFYAYSVTTVDQNNRESQAAVVTADNFALDQTATNPIFNRLTWAAVAGAYKYRIYKAQPVPAGQQGGGPYVVGLVGEAFDTVFNDMNFAPEFDTGPPIGRNPFLDNGIASVTITNSGQGYISPFLTITDATGSGAQVSLQSDLSLSASPYGEIKIANVIASGTDYTAPVATVGDAAPLGSGLQLAFNGSWVANPLGTGFVPAPGSITIAVRGNNYHQSSYNNFIEAVAGGPAGSNKLLIDVTQVLFGQVQSIAWANSDITPTPADGLSLTGTGDTITFNIIGSDTPGTGAAVTLALGGTTNPSCVGYYQQRLVFAGSVGAPATFWMSRPGQFTNFDVSDPTQDDDAITASLFASEVNIIHALTTVTDGLMALTSGGAYLITGGDDSAAVTPSSVRAPPQAFSGAQADLQPLRIGDSVLYAQARGSAVRDLKFEFYSNSFTGSDISVLSQHLLEGRRIVQWAYAEEPNKLVWATRDDGVLLSLTYLKEQEVYGWARHDTQGAFISVCSIPEGTEDAVYLVVSRRRPDYGFAYHVERFVSRSLGANLALTIPASPDEAWCVDGGAIFAPESPDFLLTSGEPQGVGVLYEVVVDAPGSGYDAGDFAEVIDISGTGGIINLTIAGGQVTGASIGAGGSGYANPQIVVRSPGGGSGAVLTVRPATLLRLKFAASPFLVGDIGKIVRVRGGRGVIVAVPAADELLVDFHKQPPVGLANSDPFIIPPTRGGQWSFGREVSVVGGLDHLNSSVVQVLADGVVQTPKVVIDGCVELDEPASSVIVGQGYTCQLQTPRLEVQQPTSQGRRKMMPQLHIRAKDTRGLFAGPSWHAMTEIKERENEAMGSPVSFHTGGTMLPRAYPDAPTAYEPVWYQDKYLIMAAEWNDEGVVCIQQSYPLPATILAVIPAVMPGGP